MWVQVPPAAPRIRRLLHKEASFFISQPNANFQGQPCLGEEFMSTSQRFHANMVSVRPKSNARVMLIILIAFCGIFMIGYASRLAKKATLAAEAVHWEARIDQAKQQRLVLAAERNYVNSNAYIEKEARDELGLAKQGDELVILVASTPTPFVSAKAEINAEVKKQGNSNWRRWFSLFLPETSTAQP
ncbi:MAG: septum formation initiator family protein [Caldilineaceae bacterium]